MLKRQEIPPVTGKKRRSRLPLRIMTTCPHKLHSNRVSDSFKYICDRNDSTNINDGNVSDFNGTRSVTIRYS